ncbi:MAG: DUF4430 domain-containing protein [Gracilibacteraceae bacterium]|jgi:hypothetical protein|nr:DUF4430 domain-containing protein [Gracilibacteraceae bacterium]
MKSSSIRVKLIAAAVAAAALLAAWLWDGSPPESAAPVSAQTLQDQYLTSPAPPDRPKPIEPDPGAAPGEERSCTLSVRCDALLANLDRLDAEKRRLAPADGVIFPATEVTFYEGESVFDLLRREMRSAGIHMEFTSVPLYNSAYIEGINNFYEFDAGELSGWMYRVNGWFPNYGSSRYRLQSGDEVEWVYTCDLGDDVGGGWAAGRT